MAAVEVWGGAVNTWECDRNGHMNVRFYVSKAMQGLAGLAAELGMPRVFARSANSTLMVRDQHIRFLRESHPGGWLSMDGGVLAMGETDARVLLVLLHPTGDPCATFQTQVQHVTAEGRAFPWPQRMRERAAALACNLPEYAAPRSIALDPVETTASLERAEALGLRNAGRGVSLEEECDAFGRMRPETFMAKLSDGVSRVLAAEGPVYRPPGLSDDQIGGAALEYRQVYFDWPRAGDRYLLRSGLAGTDERTRRLVHWLLDPDSGRPWAVAEAIAVSLDLAARKIIKLPPEAQAQVMKQGFPGLAL